ncbi:apoptosis regulator BAX-like [Dendronephthya gigantea]|uniref:apoptosis regulator BAX-like n=1 Tax=Dendronephthya gigantea TaxID=151771 RepID=UPI00106D3475|nr:apoptosis regulator BAX-like [Dendronephthya gigantea]
MAPPDSGTQRQIQRQRQTSTDEVMVETPDIVTFFIADRVREQGLVVPEEMRAISVNGEVASCLRQVGDDLENNLELNNLIGQIKVTPQTAFDTFADVANKIFADGVYNWGRIVTLLYFGFKLASSVISQVPLLKLVVDWVVRFVKERLVNWIAQQGGWRAITDHVMETARQASTYQVVGVALAGIAVFMMVLGRK